MRGDFDINFNEKLKGKMVRIHFNESFHVSEETKYEIMKKFNQIDEMVQTSSCCLDINTIRVYLKKPFNQIPGTVFIMKLFDLTQEIYTMLSEAELE